MTQTFEEKFPELGEEVYSLEELRQMSQVDGNKK